MLSTQHAAPHALTLNDFTDESLKALISVLHQEPLKSKPMITKNILTLFKSTVNSANKLQCVRNAEILVRQLSDLIQRNEAGNFNIIKLHSYINLLLQHHFEVDGDCKENIEAALDYYESIMPGEQMFIPENIKTSGVLFEENEKKVFDKILNEILECISQNKFEQAFAVYEQGLYYINTIAPTTNTPKSLAKLQNAHFHIFLKKIEYKDDNEWKVGCYFEALESYRQANDICQENNYPSAIILCSNLLTWYHETLRSMPDNVIVKKKDMLEKMNEWLNEVKNIYRYSKGDNKHIHDFIRAILHQYNVDIYTMRMGLLDTKAAIVLFRDHITIFNKIYIDFPSMRHQLASALVLYYQSIMTLYERRLNELLALPEPDCDGAHQLGKEVVNFVYAIQENNDNAFNFSKNEDAYQRLATTAQLLLTKAELACLRQHNDEYNQLKDDESRLVDYARTLVKALYFYNQTTLACQLSLDGLVMGIDIHIHALQFHEKNIQPNSPDSREIPLLISINNRIREYSKLISWMAKEEQCRLPDTIKYKKIIVDLSEWINADTMATIHNDAIGVLKKLEERQIEFNHFLEIKREAIKTANDTELKKIQMNACSHLEKRGGYFFLTPFLYHVFSVSLQVAMLCAETYLMMDYCDYYMLEKITFSEDMLANVDNQATKLKNMLDMLDEDENYEDGESTSLDPLHAMTLDALLSLQERQADLYIAFIDYHIANKNIELAQQYLEVFLNAEDFESFRTEEFAQYIDEKKNGLIEAFEGLRTLPPAVSLATAQSGMFAFSPPLPSSPSSPRSPSSSPKGDKNENPLSPSTPTKKS